jgi:hypothetical protein
VDDFVKLIRDLGFPVAVAAFILWRLEARLKELTTAIEALRAVILAWRARDAA